MVLLCLYLLMQLLPLSDGASGPAAAPRLSDPSDLLLAPFQAAFRALVTARSQSDPASGEQAVDEWQQAARLALPDDPLLRSGLLSDLEQADVLSTEEGTQLLRLVETPGLLLAAESGSVHQQLLESPDDLELLEIARAHVGLLVRWLGRESLAINGVYSWQRAVDRVQLAVLLADEQGEGGLAARARLYRLSCLRRHNLTRGGWSSLLHADAQQAEAYDLAEGLDEQVQVVRLELALASLSERGSAEALPLLTAVTETEGVSRGTLLRALAECLRALIELKDWDAADADAHRLADQLVGVDSGPAFARAELSLGIWHRSRLPEPGESDQQRLGKAVEALERAASQVDCDYDKGEVLDWLSGPLATLGRFDQARAVLEQCRTIFQGCNIQAMPHLLSQTAWIEYQAGSYGRALSLLDEQLTWAEDGRLDAQAGNYQIRARVLLAQNDLPGAVAALMALLHVEDSQIAAAPAGFRVFSAAEACETHGVLVDLLERLTEQGADPELTFAMATGIIEHARARLLRRDLATEPSLSGLGILADTERVPFTDTTLPELPEGVAELRWFIARALTGKIEERDRYVLLARRGDERLLLPVGPVDEVDRQVQAFLDGWLVPGALDRTPAEYVRQVEPLSERLLGPARAWLDDGIERLLVMTDGSIERLPLQALLLKRPIDSVVRFDQLPFLVRAASVLHTPSLAILQALPHPSERAAALGVFVQRVDDNALRHLDGEQRTLRRDHPGSVVLNGDQASAMSLRRALTSQPFGWLHLASHARVQVGPDRSAALVLAGGPSALLDSTAVKQLPLEPGVRVVLSACGTATGEFHRGEGVMGLWRAFFLAGASCVVSTLHAVDDRSTAVWMGAFHDHAAAGLPVAEALRAASLDWLDGRVRPTYPRGSSVVDPAHPYLWAAFLCMGRDEGRLPHLP